MTTKTKFEILFTEELATLSEDELQSTVEMAEKLKLRIGKKLRERVVTIMNALSVELIDALRIVKHLQKNDCIDWIDYYNEDNRSNEPLTDVHYESDFEDMIDWKFDDAKPSEILGMSANIKDHPDMLELEDKIIFWYGLV